MGYNDVGGSEPFTEEEYRQAQEKLDTFRRGRKKIHLHQCQSVNHSMSRHITEWSPDSVPYGFWEVCPFCREWWRDEIDTTAPET